MAAQAKCGGPRWSSHLVFVLAAAGAAVGLGNLWRFPFIAGENGGGAFVLVYVAAVALIGYPIMVAELFVGRRGRGNAGHAVRAVSEESGAGRIWRIIGALSIFIPFVGVGYYSVVAGWTIDYMIAFIASGGFPGADAAGFEARFTALQEAPLRLLLLHLAFMAGIMFVVAHELHSGIERVARIAMPALFVLLLIVVGFALVEGDAARGLAFLFAPDFSALTWRGVLLALGQAFFSLAVGIGAMMTFGSYLEGRDSLPRSAAQICLTDTAAALLAGIAIFPIVFAFGLDPAQGEGLTFVTLPTAFAQMAGGYFVGSAFFILLFVAAFTTGIATLEPVVRWLIDRGMTRRRAALLSGGATWLIGAAAALSFNVWKGVRPLGFIPGWEERTLFGVLDFSIASLLLPINGLLIALFVGWAVRRAILTDELGAAGALLTLWRWLLRLLVPAAILAILILG